MPVRKPCHGGKRVIGTFASKKMQRGIDWESKLEHDAVYHIEYDPDVVTYEEQPFKWKYLDRGKPRVYIPDFKLVRSSSVFPYIIEVKEEEALLDPHVSTRLKLLQESFSRKRMNFQVWTERTIRVHPLLDNLKFFHRYAWTQLTLRHELLLIELFENHREISASEVEGGLLTIGAGRDVLWALLASGILDMDRNCMLNGDSPIRYTGKAVPERGKRHVAH